MSEVDRDMLMDLLATAPGPVPWYIRGRDPGVTREGRPLAWVEADPEGPLHGYHVLEDDGRPLLLVRMYSIVAPLEGNRLLVAFKRSQPDVLAIHLFEVDTLTPLEDSQAVARIIENPDLSCCSAAEPAAQVVIPRRISPGVHPFHFPPPFHGLGETALISALAQSAGPLHETRSAAIFVLRPEIHRLEIIPQTWFNDGPYQHGFQWITRAVRDPFSGRILGEGIRLGYFLLNDSGDQVEEWVQESRSHLP